jgi:hypothetical protein
MKKILLAACLLLLAPTVWAEVAVIVHLRNTSASPALRDVQDIFLGRVRAFPDERYTVPIDQPPPLRAEFYQLLTFRPLAQINAYWAQILFTGQNSPPLQLPNDQAVLKMVRENEGAIGYVSPATVDRTVRLLLLLKP